MAICSLAFLLYCGAVVIVYHLAPVKFVRRGILATASGAFLFLLVPNLRSWVWFAVMLAVTYLALVAVRRWRRGIGVAIAAGTSLLLYLYLKRFTFFADYVPVPLEWDLRLHPVELVGLSYMIFKFIHMLVDEWQGQLAPFDLWTYLNYQLSFFTITAGPIQRYNDFRQSWDEVALRPSEARQIVLLWIRILTGMIKIGVLGAYLESVYARHHLARPALADFFVCLYFYPAYLYLNFSGYTDVMIGAGGLLGFRLPENFNRPYLARNVLDFWDRWHISLTHWIRDYVFMASYKTAATRFPGAARYWSYTLLFMALFVAGVWHGTTNGFVVFGALNGLGAAATRAYGDRLRARLGHSGMHAYLQNRLVRVVATVVTLHYVCFCHLFFSSDIRHAWKLLAAASVGFAHLPALVSSSAWQLRGILALAAAALALAGLWKSDTIATVTAKLAAGTAERPRLLFTLMSLLTVMVVSVFFVDWVRQQEPPPVLYMAF